MKKVLNVMMKRKRKCLNSFIYTVKHICKLKSKYVDSIQSRVTMVPPLERYSDRDLLSGRL